MLVLALLGVLAAAVLLLLARLLTRLALLIFLGLLALLVLLILSHGSLLKHRRNISAPSPWTQIEQGSTFLDC